MPPRVFLGLGANVGNRIENLRLALRWLDGRDGDDPQIAQMTQMGDDVGDPQRTQGSQRSGWGDDGDDPQIAQITQMGDDHGDPQRTQGSQKGRCRVVAVSSLYQSAALVLEGSPPGPDYYNAAVEVQTDLSPRELLFHVKQIEYAIGRRPAERWAPRPIDIDILLYGDTIVDAPELQIPHPSLIARNFVMAPLVELAGDVLHPVLSKTIGALAEDVNYDGLSLIAERGWATRTGEPGVKR